MPLLPAALISSMLYFQMVIMAGTVMLAYYFEYTDTFTVNVQGFFCHDSAYRKPYPGPEDSSAVPPVLLYSLAAGVPVLVVSSGLLALSCLLQVEAPPGGLGNTSFHHLSSSNLVATLFPQRTFSWGAWGWVKRKHPCLSKPPLHPRLSLQGWVAQRQGIDLQKVLGGWQR